MVETSIFLFEHNVLFLNVFMSIINENIIGKTLHGAFVIATAFILSVAYILFHSCNIFNILHSTQSFLPHLHHLNI